MTTELSAPPIIDDSRPQSRDQSSRDTTNNQNQWSSQPDSSTDETGTSTPIDPLDPPPARPPNAHLEQSGDIPRPLLVKARSTGEYMQHIHNQSRNRFLVAEGGPLAVRKFSLSDDYGLDELRAPPILPDRERRKSLEHSLSRRPSSLTRRTTGERIHEDITVASWITFLAIWGSLARIGLNALTTYPGAPVFPLIWSQWVGCAIMGFLLQDKVLFPKEDRYVALYIGLSTGFCGSITSFSTFMLNCFQALANLDPYYDRSRGRNVLALFAQVIITLCVSIAALRLGAHCAQVTRSLLPSLRPLPGIKRYLDVVGLLLAITGWAAAGIMTGLIPEWRPQLFTVVFAPAGALCRWQLSRFNPYIPSFPLGTFAANMAGTVILGICVLIQSRDRSPISTVSCAVLYGIDQGFCGCLSTVSTFAVELDTLMRLHAYVYATVSIVVGIISLVILVGISAWAVGYVSVCGL